MLDSIMGGGGGGNIFGMVGGIDCDCQQQVDDANKDWKEQFIDDLVKQILQDVRTAMGQDSKTGSSSEKGGAEGSSDSTSTVAPSSPRTDEEDDAGSGTGGWLQAIAKAMGNAMGNKAAKLVELSQAMEKATEEPAAGGATGGEGGSGGVSADTAAKTAEGEKAREFNKLNAQFQATSQEYSILSNAFSTALKALGEALVGMARKQ